MTQDPQTEFITIIAASPAEALAQYRAQHLAADGYAIVHRIDRHEFHLVAEGLATNLFAGRQMFAATFRRSAGTTAPHTLKAS